MDLVREFFSSIISLVAAGVFFVILQKIWPSVKEQKSWRKESKLDLTYWAVSTLATALVSTFIVAFIITIVGVFLYPTLLEKINSTTNLETSIIQVIIATILLDFFAYWIHRIFHTPKLWDYHAIHHSSKELDWLSSVRFHPLEAIAIIVIIYSLCVILGLGFKEVGLALAIRSIYGYMVHANITWSFGILGYIFASPHFHRWHHAKNKEAIDKNFAGVFSLWDFIFGTAYFPRDKRATNLGIHQNIGESFFNHLLHPFRKKKSK